ncbi:MAG TPA: TonB family protein [Dokdonella sp.]|nr:TonB family protein [Dokdonella sp.]
MNLLAENLPWVQALGWSLVHFLWQGLLIGALFALVRSLVPGEHSSIRYAVGLLAMSMLALCPMLTLWVLWPQAGSASATIADAVVLQAVSSRVGSMVEPGSMVSELLPVLVLVWLVGVTFMVWRGVHQWRALKRIATVLASRSREIEDMLQRVAQRFGGMPGARVLVSTFIDTPTLIGWFKPVILLPAAVVTGFPREQLELILAHELGHLRRYDHLANLGQAIVETLLFYHPVVHWISREIRHEREICCDNLVLRLTDSEPREYARTLAALEDVRQLTPQLAVAASGGILLDRVRRIIGSTSARNPSRRSHRSAWLVAAVSAGFVVTMAVMTRPGESEPKETFASPVMARALQSEFDLPSVFDVAASQPVAFASLPGLALSVDQAVEARQPARARVGSAVTVGDIDPVPHQTAELAALPRPPVAEMSRLPIQVGDVDLARVEQTPVPVAAEATAFEQPTVLRRVAPDYKNQRSGEQELRVGFEFAIDKSGNVRDIRVVSGDRSSAFAAAARRALSQWQFDPASVRAGARGKFRQDFEFVAGVRLASTDEPGCTPPLGSHVCRPVQGTGGPITRTIERESRSFAQTGPGEACTPVTGSRVCRPADVAGPSEPNGPDEATMAHLVVLAGGSH